MSIQRCLDLMSNHVSQETMQAMSRAPSWGPITVAPYEYGAFVSVPSNDGECNVDDLRCPVDLKIVLNKARSLGCDIVCFDAAADALDGLPYFDW